MTSFDDIRPYFDSEIPAAIETISNWELLPQVIRFIYPDMGREEAERKLKNISDVYQLQSTFMNDAICRIIRETTDGFSFSGLRYLRRDTPYLFVSNHRDITLDAFLLQHLLIEHRFDTTHIVFGENLLSMPVIEVLFRSNKLIRMERGGSPRAFYNSLRHLSEYLRHLMLEEQHSVWIAQRNGRAKDGIDSTAPAMLKMLTLGCSDPIGMLESLHIVPVSISYEWDPCDAMKARELLLSRDEEYKKAKDEDLKSVITGIIGKKGGVHMHIGRPLGKRDIIPQDGVDVADHVAAVIDRVIQRNYRLMPTNYYAYNILTNSMLHSAAAKKVKGSFIERLNSLPSEEMRSMVLRMYANPVFSAIKQSKRRG